MLDLERVEDRDNVRRCRTQLRNTRTSARALMEPVRDRLTALEAASPREIDADADLRTLDYVLEQPGDVDAATLTTYVERLISVMLETGAGLRFVGCLDRVIEFYRARGYPLCDLYLAKASYLGLTGVEASERDEAFEEAKRHAPGPEELMKTRIALAAYYQSSSQYEKCLETCRACQDLIDAHKQLEHYRAAILATQGVVHFYRFDYEIAKQYYEQVLAVVDSTPDDAQLANALHHLGRIAAAQGEIVRAMEYYVTGLSLDERSPPGLSTSAFHHLRLGELLTSAGLLDQAMDHVIEAQSLFGEVRDSSSSQVQVDMALADLYVLRREYKRAEHLMRSSIQVSRRRGYPRGVLYGLERLFWLQFRRLRIPQAGLILLQAMRTWRGGEFGRNAGPRMLMLYLGKVPLILSRIARGSFHNVLGPPSPRERITTCTCPMHQKWGKGPASQSEPQAANEP